jgi:hypothetical protein
MSLFAPTLRHAFVGALALAFATACASSNETHSAYGSAPDGKTATSASYSAQDAHQEMKLPPGWTEADMQACMVAGTPGKMHEHLAESTGVWQGKQTIWMAPGAEPMQSECTSTITPVMDGRYTKCDVAGEMPGMGPFHGSAYYGYDNVIQKFVATWIDSHSTGIMNGTGELSADGKTMTWTYTYNCPIRKAPTTMREVQKMTGDNSMTMEMFGADPKSGKEYKMMVIEFKRTSKSPAG